VTGRLEIEGVYTAYDKADVLEGISLKVEPGRITCLLGSNGSGKTTLIRSILGLTPARAGHIAFNGQDITALPTHKVIAAGVACIPEGRKVFPKLTVEENLRLGAYTRRDREVAQDFERVYGYFPRLKERFRQQAGTLSGGEQQMLAISRALMLRPKLLLLDEPSFGLAPLVVQEIFRILRAINRQEGMSMLLVEQNASIALELADQAYLLETGRIIMAGASGVISRDESVRRAYLG
jgi:branched-chain amino acid transport system ATP-binding protein